MLRWARARAGSSVDATARSTAIKPQQLQAWETGEERPTFRQAQTLAQVLHIPFGYLFLQEPPQDQLPLPDLRTVRGAPLEQPSVNLLDTVRLAMQRQAWYLEHLAEQGREPLPFVGKFNLRTSAQKIASDIRAVLESGIDRQRLQPDEYFAELIKSAERAGVLVMRSGIVGNNTRRTLDVSEFRGFAISDPMAPVVFINIADAPAARLFTLIHELAHIWLGSSGVSSVGVDNHTGAERLCNAVAGEFLAPATEFLALWERGAADLGQRVADLARHFRVSPLVSMRRALDLGLLDRGTYSDFYRAELEKFRAREGGGGSFYRSASAKNSKRFAQAVVTEALSGRLLLRDAGLLLGVQPSKIRTFAEQLSA